MFFILFISNFLDVPSKYTYASLLVAQAITLHEVSCLEVNGSPRLSRLTKFQLTSSNSNIKKRSISLERQSKFITRLMFCQAANELAQPLRRNNRQLYLNRYTAFPLTYANNHSVQTFFHFSDHILYNVSRNNLWSLKLTSMSQTSMKKSHQQLWKHHLCWKNEQKIWQTCYIWHIHISILQWVVNIAEKKTSATMKT